MSAPWNIVRFRVDNVAGYRTIQWRELQPLTNVLVGQNGTGKSTLFEAMIVALNFLAGRHARDNFVRTYPEAAFEVEFAEPGQVEQFTNADIRRRGGSVKTNRNYALLQLVENRQPKGIVGRHGSHWLNNPIQRYEAALSETKRLLLSKQMDEQALAAEVIALCKRVPEAGRSEDWDWIREETRRRGQTHARPLSCGQFDVLALTLDLVRFRQNLEGSQAPNFVFVDNLETFLHPACLESVLRLIRFVLSTAQLFVASHSMKLLLGRPAKSIFWLPRDARRVGVLDVGSIRELSAGARAAFFELYGDDVSNGVLSLVSMLESPHYAEWLAECALSCRAIARPSPTTDPQMRIVTGEVREHHEPVVLDVGAGAGDVLRAIVAAEFDASAVTYLAFDPSRTSDASARLRECVTEAVSSGAVASDSRVIETLDEAPAACDLIALCNVCHTIKIPTLAQEMAMLLSRHLRPAPGATLLIIEVRTLGRGEEPFYLWTPEEWALALGGVSGLRLDRATLGEPGHPEGIDATFIRWVAPLPDPDTLAKAIESRFWSIIPDKRARALEELAERQPSRLRGHDEAWRQRRVAFLCAQIAWLDMAEKEHASSWAPAGS